MDEGSGTDKAKAPPAARRLRLVRWLLPVASLVVIVLLALNEGQEVLEQIRTADFAVSNAVGSVSIPTLTAAFIDRFKSCHYAYLVLCEEPGCLEYAAARSPSAPDAGSSARDLFAGSTGMTLQDIARELDAPPPGSCIRREPSNCGYLCDPAAYSDRNRPNAFLAGVQLLPEIPDALLHVLKTRFAAAVALPVAPKPIVDLVFMVVFIAATLLIMVAILVASDLNLLTRAYLFTGSVVVAPLVVSGLLWLLQLFFLWVAGAIGLVLQGLILAGSIPTALAVTLNAIHLNKSLYESAKELWETVRPL